MNLKKLLSTAAIAAIASAVPASAALISVTGSLSSAGEAAEIIVPAAGDMLTDDGINALHQVGFDEEQDVMLTSSVDVDGGGSIAMDTVVDSHMILLNRGPVLQTLTHRNVTWTFDSVILGVMSDNGGLLEEASTGQLGRSDLNYPAAFGNRGLEPGGVDDDNYLVSADGKSITVNLQVIQPGDWIRVVTQAPNNEIPEPGTVFLFGAGLLGAAFMRRRKNS